MKLNPKRTFLTAKSIWILFVLLLTHACSMSHTQDALLQSADSLMKSRPDSALIILESISSEKLSNPADRAKYALLFTQAQDKNYIVHTSDSLIRIAVDYYDSINNKDLAAKAHFYHGRVCQSMKNAPEAIKQYSRVLSMVEKTGNYELTCMSQGNMAQIFYQQDLLKKADSLFRQVELLSTQHNDSSRLAVALRTRGEICMEKGDQDEALTVLEKAYFISQMLNNKKIERMVVGSLSSLYSRMNNGCTAETFAWKFLQLSDSNQQYGAYLLLGDAYFKQEKFDSSAFYVSKSLPANNPETRQGAYMRLSDIARISGDFERAIRMEDSANVYKNLVHLSKQTIAVVESQKETQSQNLMQAIEENLISYRYIVGILFAVFILILTLLVFRKRKQRLESEKKQIDLQSQRRQLEDNLQQKNTEIHDLRLEIDKYELAHKNTESLLNEITELEKEKKRLRQHFLEQTEVYAKIKRMTTYYKKYSDWNEELKLNDWNELMSIPDLIEWFPKSCQQATEVLTEKEIQVSCLLKIGLTVIEISVVMRRSRDAINKHVKNIMNKLGYSEEMTFFLKDLSSFL